MSHLPFTVVGQDKRIFAATSHVKTALILAVLYGDGCRIRVCGRTVWREAAEAASAADRYDAAAECVYERMRQHDEDSSEWVEAVYRRTIGAKR